MTTAIETIPNSDPVADYKARLVHLVKRDIIRDRVFSRIGYSPHPKQWEVHNAISRGATRILLRWGRRAGKTATGSAEGIVESAFRPIGMMPHRLIKHCGPEFDVTDRVGAYVWKWCVDGEITAFDQKPIRSSERERWIEFPWKSRIEGVTTGKPVSLLGDGVVAVISDEHAESAANIYDQYLEPPTFDTGGWIMVISTPRGRLNHMYDLEQQFKREVDAGNPVYFVSHATSYDNPYNNRERIDKYVERCKSSGQYELAVQEVYAEYTTLAGAVFKNFYPDKDGKPYHVDDVPYIPGLPVYGAVDWGTAHNFACVFFQIVDDTIIRVFRLISEADLDPVQCADRVISVLYEYDCIDNVMSFYCDPSNLGNKKLFINLGIPVYQPESSDKSALNDVLGGIATVKEYLAKTTWEGKPCVMIDKSCVNLVIGLQSYKWGSNNRPEKINDDEVDAFRYGIMGALGLKHYDLSVYML